RSPVQFTEEGFRAFNRLYVSTLERWQIFKDEANPVARSNVCPEVGPPETPSFHAFSYTVPAPPDVRPSFVIAGSGEAAEGPGNYRERIVCLGDTSPAGLREKARWVLGAMEARLAALGLSWADVTATQVYTVHDLHPFLADEIAGRGAMPGGLTWQFARPPIQGLDYEMDVRGVSKEIVI
ncbi:MAG: 2-amino-5-chloromuconate deaminase CnbZ, partial [Pseudomonadota bacterium]